MICMIVAILCLLRCAFYNVIPTTHQVLFILYAIGLELAFEAVAGWLIRKVN